MDQNNDSVPVPDIFSTELTSLQIRQFQRDVWMMESGSGGDVDRGEKFCYVEYVHRVGLIQTDPSSSLTYADNLISSQSNPSNSQRIRTPEGRGIKGIPWSNEERRLFLEGLQKYGRSQWKNISKEFVKTRTHTQVASHAQKYFLRLGKSDDKKRKRSSIHDIPLTPQEPPNAPSFTAPTTDQISQQQEHYQPPGSALDYLFKRQIIREQIIRFFSFLTPNQLNKVAHYAALVRDHANRLANQYNQIDYTNQETDQATRPQFNWQPQTEALHRAGVDQCDFNQQQHPAIFSAPRLGQTQQQAPFQGMTQAFTNHRI